MKTKKYLPVLASIIVLMASLTGGCKKMDDTDLSTARNFDWWGVEPIIYEVGGAYYVRIVIENGNENLNVTAITLQMANNVNYDYTSSGTFVGTKEKFELPDVYPYIAGFWKVTITGKAASDNLDFSKTIKFQVKIQ